MVEESVLFEVGTEVLYILHMKFIFKINTLRTVSFKLFKRPFAGFLTILTL